MESASSRTAPTLTRPCTAPGALRVVADAAVYPPRRPGGLTRTSAHGIMGLVSGSGREGLFDALFGHGAVGAGDQDWLQALLDAEAALARAAERAGLAGVGTGAAVTAAARAELFDMAEI